MVVRRRPSTTRITGAWNVLPAKPKPTSPTLSMTGIVHHALSAATSVGGATAWSRRAGANIIDEPNPPRCDQGAVSMSEESLSDQRYELEPIGWVESPLVDR